MWCSSCRADVAAELSTDNRRMLCARCQSELGMTATMTPSVSSPPRTVETERDARELLARWSTQNLLETNPSLTPNAAPKMGAGRDGKFERSQVRFDAPSSTPPAASEPFFAALKDSPIAAVSGSSDKPLDRDAYESSATKQTTKHREVSRVDPAHQVTTQSPSAEEVQGSIQDQDRIVRDALQKQLNRRFGWSTFAGQLFAYGGVGALTCGTVLVMWSYFGGPPSYLPTGLLTAAVGQMLLFLGVVTLISSGMEQTVHEVSWRIDHLAQEIYHMGLALDDLESQHHGGVQAPGPKAPSPEDGYSRKAA